MIYYIVAKHSDKICDEYIKPTVPSDRTIYVQDAPARTSMMKKYNDGLSAL